MNYPTSLDNGTTLPNPQATDKQNSPDHAGLHTQENLAIIALETKVGIGSSTPVSSTLLFGTGAGTSAWQGLTSAQLASVLSDETGTGSAVFANTPTLITPKVDTINESTLNNGVTVGGVNLKSGVITGTVGTNGVPTVALQSSSVTTAKLGLSKTTDANGWTKYDFNAWQEYRKRVTFTSVSVATGPTSLPISSTTLPVGISSIGTNFLNYTWTASATAGALLIVYEGGTSATTLNFTASSADTVRTYSGFIDITLITP